jgi:hypothetical protein
MLEMGASTRVRKGATALRARGIHRFLSQEETVVRRIGARTPQVGDGGAENKCKESNTSSDGVGDGGEEKRSADESSTSSDWE